MPLSADPTDIRTGGPTFPPVSVAVLAKLLDLTERRIQQLAKQGILSKTAHGKYDLLTAVREYVRYLHQMNEPSHEDPDKMAPKERLDWYRGEMEKIRLAEARGKLIPSEAVVALGSAVISAARTRILAIPSKVRGRFPEVEPVVIDEIEALAREALTELGDDGLHPDLQRRIGASVPGVVPPAEADAKPVG